MDILKKEIERKRKQIEEAKVLDSNQKFFKRGKYMAKEQEEYFKRNGYQHVQILEEKKSAEETETDLSSDLEKASLSRREVIKRLRERGEPITLFAETELDSYKRLHQLEMSSTDINKGFRNDFQAAMDQVDQAYLSELFKAQPDESNKSTNDVSVQDHGITMEEISTKTKKLGRGNKEIDCQIILDFLTLLLAMWGQKLNSRSEEDKRSVKGKLDSATYSQSQTYLKPLFRKLRTQSLPEDILDSLREIYVHLLDRHYVKANDAYLQMAIGNAPWPIGVTMVGIHARTGREKIFSKNVAHVLNDETQRKYIQALKRLMTKCQEFFPTDPSRSVEYKGEH